MAEATFFWHDYETFGLDPQSSFAAQFAGVRTDYDFNAVGEPVVLYCKPSADCLPEPDACLITGITPQLASEKGVCEAEFIGAIHQQLAQSKTCNLGYNTLRFDDEVTRNTLYRNFYDPYQREWQNGNSRWDLIDVVRATRALRPCGIAWVDNEEGRPSFKLTDLTQANNIMHEAAHDALSDVHATIAMAGLVKQVQAKLFNFLFENRLKNKVLDLLQLGSFKPLVHVSGKYLARKNCLAVILPICHHPTNANEVVVYDVSVDPQPLLDLTAEEIKQRIFVANADLPEGVERMPLKTVHINKCPVLAPFSVLTTNGTAQRLELDLSLCLANAEKIKAAPQLAAKLALVFGSRADNYEPHTDPDLMIYSGGFFGNQDKAAMLKIRNTPVSELAGLKVKFADKRLDEMFFRYKARNYPQVLSAEEQQRWQTFCYVRINEKKEAYLARIAQLKQQPDIDFNVIQALEDYLAEKLTTLQG